MLEISDILKIFNLGPQNFSLTSTSIWRIVGAYLWLLLPLILLLLLSPLKFFYLFWRRVRWDARIEKILLEIKIPKEVAKPIKAMEYVIAGFHGIHDPANFRERWIDGQFQLSLSLEIVSLGGETHFFIRTPLPFRKHIESSIYAQYPEAEISLVDDYTKYVPQDIPKKGWDLWGADFMITKPDCYPIKTYPQFEVEQESKEERKVDPLAQFLEGLSALKPGEQFWFQIIIKPIIDEIPWVKRGREIADKIARRPASKVPRPIIQEAAEVLVLGPTPTAPAEKELFPPEMKLTPGERIILAAIEEKIGKFGFDTNIRFIYLGKEGVFFRPNIRSAMGYMKTISTLNLNGLRPFPPTMTKIMWFFRSRRLYIRKRRMFRYYQKRWPTFFPRTGGTYVFNSEEIATLYHFPGRMVAPAPALPRVEAKKGEPPADLPIG